MGIGDINVESQGLGTGKRSRSRLDSTYPKRSSDTKSVACWKKLISSHSFFLFPKLTGASSDSTRAKVPCAARIYGRRDGGCLGWIQGASPSTVESSEVVRVLVCVCWGGGGRCTLSSRFGTSTGTPSGPTRHSCVVHLFDGTSDARRCFCLRARRDEARRRGCCAPPAVSGAPPRAREYLTTGPTSAIRKMHGCEDPTTGPILTRRGGEGRA